MSLTLGGKYLWTLPQHSSGGFIGMTDIRWITA